MKSTDMDRLIMVLESIDERLSDLVHSVDSVAKKIDESTVAQHASDGSGDNVADTILSFHLTMIDAMEHVTGRHLVDVEDGPKAGDRMKEED